LDLAKDYNAGSAPLAGIGIIAIIVLMFQLDTPVVGDLASIKGGFPPFHIHQSLSRLRLFISFALFNDPRGDWPDRKPVDPELGRRNHQ
jgi:hypothetical protein